MPATANTATRCGFSSGWRLPTRRELLSIVHNGTSNPSIDTVHFPNTIASNLTFYWSNNTFAPNPVVVWVVDFFDGSTNAGDNSNNFAVRLVRSGQ